MQLFYSTFLEKARCPVRIDNNETKKPSPSRDSNLVCTDRMPWLYHLRHHHCPVRIKMSHLGIKVTVEAQSFQSKEEKLLEKKQF